MRWRSVDEFLVEALHSELKDQFIVMYVSTVLDNTIVNDFFNI